jgi:hypothetical protein
MRISSWLGKPVIPVAVHTLVPMMRRIVASSQWLPSPGDRPRKATSDYVPARVHTRRAGRSRPAAGAGRAILPKWCQHESIRNRTMTKSLHRSRCRTWSGRSSPGPSPRARPRTPSGGVARPADPNCHFGTFTPWTAQLGRRLGFVIRSVRGLEAGCRRVETTRTRNWPPDSPRVTRRDVCHRRGDRHPHLPVGDPGDGLPALGSPTNTVYVGALLPQRTDAVPTRSLHHGMERSCRSGVSGNCRRSGSIEAHRTHDRGGRGLPKFGGHTLQLLLERLMLTPSGRTGPRRPPRRSC